MKHPNDTTLEEYQRNLDKKEKAFYETLASSHPETELKVGDIVTFTNEYGVVFKGKRVAGFHHEAMGEQLTNRIVYLEKDAYWFPVPVASLTLEGQSAPSSVDNWS